MEVAVECDRMARPSVDYRVTVFWAGVHVHLRSEMPVFHVMMMTVRFGYFIGQVYCVKMILYDVG